jgi:hypothetical protein
MPPSLFDNLPSGPWQAKEQPEMPGWWCVQTESGQRICQNMLSKEHAEAISQLPELRSALEKTINEFIAYMVNERETMKSPKFDNA